MTSSKWGDEHLYFKHTFYARDLEYHPEWEPYVFNAQKFFDSGDGFALRDQDRHDVFDADEALFTALNKQVTHGGCPFAALFDFLS